MNDRGLQTRIHVRRLMHHLSADADASIDDVAREADVAIRTFEELHDDLLELLRPGEGLEVHVNLLRHGRRTCHAQRPRCGECALARMCPSRALFSSQPRGSTANAITA